MMPINYIFLRIVTIRSSRDYNETIKIIVLFINIIAYTCKTIIIANTAHIPNFRVVIIIVVPNAYCNCTL